ncbi:MAG: tetratricopeptide repeat protein [Acidobacteriota bacterium]
MKVERSSSIVIHLSIAVAMVLALAVPGLQAAGGSSAPPSTDPADTATAAYERGLQARDKAWELEKQMQGADAGDQERLASRITTQYEKAARAFRAATEDNPKMYQAFSSLGYALRKTGDYDGSLAAYNQALELNPTYFEAIEYRAEAYLGLGELDKVKEAYMHLFRENRERADELMDAMQTWVNERRQTPSALDTATVESFAAWVDERAEVAGNTASLIGGSSSWSSD